MSRLSKINNSARRAHFAATKAAQDLMLAVVDHDPDYEDSTVMAFEAAAEQLEKSARDLRDGIAVFRDTKPAS